MKNCIFLVVGMLLVLMNPAVAQPVYKCTVDGKLAYGDRPCAGVPSVELDVPAAAPADPHLAERLRRQKAAALHFEQQRSGHEGRGKRTTRASAAHRRRCAKLQLTQRWMDEDIDKVMSERREATRTKAQRHRQSMALECPA